jgi:hypothetical protein
MSINCQQLRDVIISPVLTALGMSSPSAVNLILGTCAQETAMGEYLIQRGIGLNGGIGIYQMEKRTYDSICEHMIKDNIVRYAKIKLLLGYTCMPPAERMASDLYLATAMTRLYYYAIQSALPNPDDVIGLANYWKKYYNTAKGKGTIEQFVSNYKKYVK